MEQAIEYNYKKTKGRLDKSNVTVKLKKRKIGEIRKVAGGWQYFPKGQKLGGEIFPAFHRVQKSLEQE